MENIFTSGPHCVCYVTHLPSRGNNILEAILKVDADLGNWSSAGER